MAVFLHDFKAHVRHQTAVVSSLVEILNKVAYKNEKARYQE